MSNLQHAHLLHKKGKLAEAQACYERILITNPHHGEALHSLGVLHAQLGDYDKALTYLNQAVAQIPHSAPLYNHLGNVLKKQSHISESIRAFEQALSLDPHFAQAYNNIGNVYLEKGDTENAIRHYVQAVTFAPHYPDAFYNLGIAYHRNHQSQNAIDAFTALLTLSPMHFGGHYHIATLYLTCKEYDKAIQHFQQAIDINPLNSEAHLNCGVCYLKKEDYTNARTHYLIALEINENNNDAEYNLGIIANEQNNPDLAIQHYLQIIKRDPAHFAAHNNVGVLLLKKQNPSLALHHFKIAQQLNPDNPSLNYIITALNHTALPDSAPKDYIKALFDQYAKNFEAHVLQSLEYQVPKHLFQALSALGALQQSAIIVDVGCGTGLCGTLFKPYAKRLVGIDLSPRMLAEASAKNNYNELIETDIIDYLQTASATFNLILAADVLVYFGNLQPLFLYALTALQPGGFFAFSVEVSEQDDYCMMKSGRFAHRFSYLERLATETGFLVRFSETRQTRLQYGSAVMGLIVVLQRATP